MKPPDPVLGVFLKNRLGDLAYARAGVPDARVGVDCEDSHFIDRGRFEHRFAVPPDPRLG